MHKMYQYGKLKICTCCCFCSQQVAKRSATTFGGRCCLKLPDRSAIDAAAGVVGARLVAITDHSVVQLPYAEANRLKGIRV